MVDKFISNSKLPTPEQAELLTVFMEELVEVIDEANQLIRLVTKCAAVHKRATKLARFGANQVQEDEVENPLKTTNLTRLGLEIGDLICVIDELKKLSLVHEIDIVNGQQQKAKKLAKYLQKRTKVREDGFYWTHGINGNLAVLAVREWRFDYWLETGLNRHIPDIEIKVVSEKLDEPVYDVYDE